MTFSVYILESKKDKIRYIGSTQNIAKRLVQHNEDKCRFTKGHRPWKIIYEEIFLTRSEAVKQERFLKSGVGRKILGSKLE